ncbi:low molecular weight protein-tyrosine-phosphatase [Bacillus sp. AFS053548]|uniref:low molecular weight protein-tyrosine-phosphatase n=1 Tax=Bacillus sp. AFS053548 TaxID=2033505 RepID=UPI000BFD2103|nr:low molecular weight protein-tyrosine-phosphatase [Bacillus sp. AFS053548]PGM56775.1 phosphotyrosine protein phosphatase [Bacillus sp. AFS053548]
MIQVLFVCLGNICRSPMAEAVFRHIVTEKGLDKQFMIDSAGTGDWHLGHPPHKGTQGLLSEKGITCEGMKARKVTENDFKYFSYIVAMDAQNKEDLMNLARNNCIGEISLLSDYVPASMWKEVPDPYYTGNFNEVYDILTEGCSHLLQHILKQHQLTV